MQDPNAAENQSQLAPPGKYRTDSAAKPFGIKKPPLNAARIASGRT